MSVTFSPAMDTTVPHVVTCICGEWTTGVVYPSYDMARMMLKDLKPSCSDLYCDYAYAVPEVSEPEVQMSNSNAFMLLSLLGLALSEDFSDYCSGSIPAEDFLGRVLLAQGLNPADAGSDTIVVGNMVDCGRPEGYTDAKLDAMREVADWAIANKREIVWG